MTRLERLAPFLFFLLSVLGTFAALAAEEVPSWVLPGIAQIETGSVIRAGVVVSYRDRRTGDAGEVSCMQLSPAALHDLHASRSRCITDQAYAVRCASRLLLRLYAVTGSWSEAIASYHRGLGGRFGDEAVGYAVRVAAAGAAR